MGFIGTVFVGLNKRFMLSLAVAMLGLVIFSEGVGAVGQTGLTDNIWEVMPGVNGEAQFGVSEGGEEAKQVETTGKGVLIIGDSITVYSKKEVEKYLPDAEIDAISGTWFSKDTKAGEGGMSRLADKDLGDIVVFAMGTNGGVTEEEVEQLVKAVDGRPVVLMTIYRPIAGDDAPDENAHFLVGDSNAAIWKMANLYPNVHVMDWREVVTQADDEQDVLLADRLHPNENGTELFAKLMQNVISVVRKKTAMQEAIAENVTTDGAATEDDAAEEDVKAITQSDLLISVWTGLLVFGVVVVTAGTMSFVAGLGRRTALRRRARAQREWREAKENEKNARAEYDDGLETEIENEVKGEVKSEEYLEEKSAGVDDEEMIEEELVNIMREEPTEDVSVTMGDVVEDELAEVVAEEEATLDDVEIMKDIEAGNVKIVDNELDDEVEDKEKLVDKSEEDVEGSDVVMSDFEEAFYESSTEIEMEERIMASFDEAKDEKMKKESSGDVATKKTTSKSKTSKKSSEEKSGKTAGRLSTTRRTYKRKKK